MARHPYRRAVVRTFDGQELDRFFTLGAAIDRAQELANQFNTTYVCTTPCACGAVKCTHRDFEWPVEPQAEAVQQ